MTGNIMTDSKSKMPKVNGFKVGIFVLCTCAVCLAIVYSVRGFDRTLKSANQNIINKEDLTLKSCLKVCNAQNNTNEWRVKDDISLSKPLRMTSKKPLRMTSKKPWTKNWQAQDLYNCENSPKPNKFVNKERLVHLDLKGAPAKISYYKKIFPLFKEMGATGLLIEYEDMFPYTGSLKELARTYAYSEAEVNEMLRLARANGLTMIIPLVQTFGHMEFVLKHKKFAELRENPSKHNAISPSHNRTMTVLKEMIRQVSRLHSSDRYFHIGSDEVYGMGNYRSAQFMKAKSFSTADLLVWHVKRVASAVLELGHKPLMWDDMFRRTTNVQLLKASGLGSMVELVVWKYSPIPQNELRASWWEKYEQVFTNVWIASGFKGADSSTDYIVRTRGRVLNHINWIKLMTKYGKIGGGKMLMKGTILTGWQRFQHYLPLCELLPAGLPSLGFSLQVLSLGCFSVKSHEYISMEVLKCDRPIAIDLLKELSQPSRCLFPGHEVYEGIQTVYCNAGHTCNKKLIPPLTADEVKNITKHMQEIFYQETVTEWAKKHL